jgi:hypothetical protein
MKKVIFKSKNLYWILSALVVFGFASCKKEHANLVGGTGVPTISSVSTVSKTVAASAGDSVTVTTYDTLGNVTVKKNPAPSSVVAFDSTTSTGNKGTLYVIRGTNLGSVTSVSFNGVLAYFNSALVSDNTILVSIPSNIPTTGAAATNKLTVVTLYGTTNFSFTTLTPPPTVSGVSDYDFTAGSQITLTGVSFATVTSVGLTGSSATATIVSQTDAQLVIKMPATTVNRANLVFTYTSAGAGATATSVQEFIDLDNAYQIFAKNSFQNAWGDNSWAGPSGTSTGASHSGTASIVATYPAGGWKIEGWANWYPSIPYDASYKYLTFWVKGGTVDHTLVLVGDQMVGGYGQVQNANAYAAQLVTVPAKVWTFFKIPLTAPSTPFAKTSTLLNYWANGTPAKQLGFFLQGMSGDVDETMYFDEVAFVK